MRTTMNSRGSGGLPQFRRTRTLRSLKIQNIVWSALLACLLLLVVELGVNFGIISSLILPKPSSVLASLISGFQNSILLGPLWSTLYATIVGFLLAAFISVVLGGLVATSGRLEAIVMPFVIAFQSTPIIAIAPVILIWAGYGLPGKVYIIAAIAFFPILVNVIAGLRIRDEDQYDLFRMMGASKWQIFRYLRAPGSLPYVFAGLNIGLLVSLLGAVVAEFVGSESGLGVYLLGQRALFNLPAVFASIAILAFLGILLRALMVFAERKIVFWSTDLSQATPS